MSDQPEPLSAILAEMRDPCAPRAPSLPALADRIEAAAARERNAHTNDIHDALYKATGIPGNAAAMREALTAFADSIQWLCDGDERGIFKKQFAPLLSDARAALAAPARNCDRFQTANEAVAAFADYLRAWENAHGIHSEYPDHPVQVPAGAFAWLFATAEGGAE